MPQTLITIGLVLVAIALLWRLAAALLQIALPAGLLLALVGVIWYFAQRSRAAPGGS